MKDLLGWSLDGALDPWSCFLISHVRPHHWTDVLAKSPGLYQGPKLRLLNLNFLGQRDGRTDRQRDQRRDRVTYISPGGG